MKPSSKLFGRDLRTFLELNSYLGFFFLALAVAMALAVFFPGASLMHAMGNVPYAMVFFVLGLIAVYLLVVDLMSHPRGKNRRGLQRSPSRVSRHRGEEAGKREQLPDRVEESGSERETQDEEEADSGGEDVRELQRKLVKLETELELTEEQTRAEFAENLGELVQDLYRIFSGSDEQFERLLKSLDYRFDGLEMKVLYDTRGEAISEFSDQFEVVESDESSELPEFHIESVELPAVLLGDSVLSEGQVVLSANRGGESADDRGSA